MTYIKKVLLAFDQLINTIFNGLPDETLSARCFREKRKTLERIINLIFFFQPNHCEEAYKSEMRRDDLGNQYRNEK